MKHFSTPAWTIGTRTRAQPVTSDKLNPPPGSYNLRPQEIEVPCHIIGTSQRPPLYSTNSNPAPSAYNVPTFPDYRQKTTDKRQEKGFKGTPRDKSDKTKMDTPGPGSYNPQKALQMPSHTMGNKTFALLNPVINEIGPDQYNPNFNSIETTKTWKIGEGKRSNLYQNSKVPGPGTYQVIPEKEGPLYGFGTEKRSKPATYQNPAPWDYNIPGMAQELKNKTGKTITPKRPPLRNNLEVPGPGAYPTHKPQYTKIQAGMSMGKGKRTDFIIGKQGPGPGGYKPQHVAHVSRKSSFGTGKRPPIYNNSATPGPGAYEYQPKFETGPKYGIVGRQPGLKELMNNPGPGNYYPNINSSKPYASSHVIGTGLRSNAIKSRPRTQPGPGHYFNFRNKEGPFWTFGKDPRSKYDVEDEPGPGQYEIPPSVPDVPKYLLTSAKVGQFNQNQFNNFWVLVQDMKELCKDY